MSESPQNNERDDAYEPDLMTLEDEAGQKHTFEVLDATDIDGERYFAMAPYAEDPKKALENDGTLLFMRLVEEEGEEEYLDIVEDEAELANVLDVFSNRLNKLYDIDVDDL